MNMRQLLTSSALATGMLALTVPAWAAEPVKLSVGGYMEQWIGYADNDSSNNTFDYADFDTQSDTEVHFLGETTLDSGLKIAVTIELEGDHPGDGIDHSWLSVTSDTYGSLILGGQEAFLNDTTISSPDVGIEHADGDLGNWVVNPGNATTGGMNVDNTFGGDVAYRVKYISPSFYGLTFGADYASDETDSNDMPDRQGGANHNYTYGVAYEGEFEGVEIGLAGGIGHRLMNTSGSYDLYGGGASLGYQGFTLSGGYLRTKQSLHQSGASGDATASSMNGFGYTVGLAYATGPYAVSLSHGYEEREATPDAAGKEDSETSWILSGAYEMGPGVSLVGSVFTNDFEGETPNDNGADDNDGWAVVSGLIVNF